METIILLVFAAALVGCVVANISVIWALVFGYILFAGYAYKKEKTIQQILWMSWSGIKKARGVLITFIFIGIMTAFWRGAGTIATIVAYVSGFMHPSIMILLIFLLNGLVSFLIGSSLATATTMGVISVTLANAMGCSPVLSGGAMMSGIYFGDRCSPVSTSALLCAELTRTDLYKNISNMLKCCIVPFVVSCCIYLVLGFSSGSVQSTMDLFGLFKREFVLTPIAVVPAILVLICAGMHVKVRMTMLTSIIASAIICIFVQHMPVSELIHIAVFGYQAGAAEVGAMMNGGGLQSMLRVAIIVCLSSTYSGLFKGTGLLDGIEDGLSKLSEGKPPVIAVTLTGILTNVVACNQTLSIMLTRQICDHLMEDKEELVITMENSVVVIAALVPWSVACAVPLSSVGVPTGSLLAACYLYLLPIWWCLYDSVKYYKNRRG